MDRAVGKHRNRHKAGRTNYFPVHLLKLTHKHIYTHSHTPHCACCVLLHSRKSLESLLTWQRFPATLFNHLEQSIISFSLGVNLRVMIYRLLVKNSHIFVNSFPLSMGRKNMNVNIPILIINGGAGILGQALWLCSFYFFLYLGSGIFWSLIFFFKCIWGKLYT